MRVQLHCTFVNARYSKRSRTLYARIGAALFPLWSPIPTTLRLLNSLTFVTRRLQGTFVVLFECRRRARNPL